LPFEQFAALMCQQALSEQRRLQQARLTPLVPVLSIERSVRPPGHYQKDLWSLQYACSLISCPCLDRMCPLSNSYASTCSSSSFPSLMLFLPKPLLSFSLATTGGNRGGHEERKSYTW
jgi:hypothetical protein